MKTFLAVVLFALAQVCAAQHSNHATLGTAAPENSAVKLGIAKDVVPDFAAAPDVRSVKSGAWTDPLTWDAGRVPRDGECAVVSVDHTVTLHGETASLRCIGTHGTLRLSSGSTVRVGTWVNYATGAIDAGSVAAPVTDVGIVILDHALNVTVDPLKFGTGILSFGAVRLHGAPKTAFVRVKQELRAGATQIVLESAPSGWRVGDRLVLPDSKQYGVTEISSRTKPTPVALTIEEPVIAAIAGSVVTLSAPLANDHPGARDHEGKVLAMPHVGNLTRSITIRSENPAGTRGHVLMTERAAIDIRYTGFVNLGRTLASSVAIAGNQIGRYPVHFHHLMGPRNEMNTGYQYVFEGNVMEDCRKWCAAIHNTHWGRVSSNIAYNADGNGIVTEEGNERGNEIVGNFVVKVGSMIQSTYKPIYGGVSLPNFKEFGWEGSCYWFTGLDNVVRGNVAANCKYVGYNVNARAAAGFAEHHPNVPRIRGADMAIASEWEDLSKYRPPRPAPAVQEMRDNEVYASTGGAWFSFHGNVGTVGSLRGWNLRQFGMYAARNKSQTYEDFWLHSDRDVANTNMRMSQGVDIFGGQYETGAIKFNRLRVEGYNVGIRMPPRTIAGDPGPVFETVDLRNNINIYGSTPWIANTVTVRDVAFETNPWGVKRQEDAPSGGPYNVTIHYAKKNNGANVARLYRMLVYPRGGEPFEAFAPQQHPDYVMPERIIGGERPSGQNCPTPGLTNAQCWAAHGVATFGRVARCLIERQDVRGTIAGDGEPPRLQGADQPGQVQQPAAGECGSRVHWVAPIRAASR